MFLMVSVVFFFLLGKMCSLYGWWSLLWVPLGFMVGLIATSAQLLPAYKLFFSLYLLLKKRVKIQVLIPVLIQLVVLNIIIFALFLALDFFFPKANECLFENCPPLHLAYDLGIFAIVFSPLAKKNRKDFWDDYSDSYQKYLMGEK
jgi:hypothetical protein